MIRWYCLETVSSDSLQFLCLSALLIEDCDVVDHGTAFANNISTPFEAIQARLGPNKVNFHGVQRIRIASKPYMYSVCLVATCLASRRHSRLGHGSPVKEHGLSVLQLTLLPRPMLR